MRLKDEENPGVSFQKPDTYGDDGYERGAYGRRPDIARLSAPWMRRTDPMDRFGPPQPISNEIESSSDDSDEQDEVAMKQVSSGRP